MAIYNPDPIYIGQNASVKWDLGGGNFDELTFNLNWAGALEPQFLVDANCQGVPVGTISALFPSLPPGCVSS